jgi:heptose-I-phosphate ethanolaminephosphotransferase
MSFIHANYKLALIVYIFLCILTNIFIKISFNKFFSALLLGLLDFILLLPSFCESAHFAIYHLGISQTAFFAFFQTNLQETFEFILAQAIYIIPLLIILIIFAFLIFYYHWHCFNLTLPVTRVLTSPLLYLQIIVLIFIVTILPTFKESKTLIGTAYSVSSYFKAIKQYQKLHAEYIKKLELNPITGVKQLPNGSILVIIEESKTSIAMSAYNKNLSYDTTPWLHQKTSDPSFYFITQGYSCYPLTIKALEYALTEESQYTHKDIYHAATIFDIAKKAGYYTVFLSNQPKAGTHDTPVSKIANTADYTAWADIKYPQNPHYDDILLKMLQEIPVKEKTFIVLHCMGNHVFYRYRYPQNYARFNLVDKKPELSEYYNALLYSDQILKQIFDYAKANLNLQAAVYFSDHGESLSYFGHNPDKFDSSMICIPGFVYLAPSYQKSYPYLASALRKNCQKGTTNDMVYNSIHGLLGVQSNCYNSKEDITSPAYAYDIDTIYSMYGKLKISTLSQNS